MLEKWKLKLIYNANYCGVTNPYLNSLNHERQ